MTEPMYSICCIIICMQMKLNETMIGNHVKGIICWTRRMLGCKIITLKSSLFFNTTIAIIAMKELQTPYCVIV